MAVFANTSITIKVLEPRKGEKPAEGGDYYWGMVDKAAPKDVFLMRATGAMKVKELKAAIAKEKGYAVESQRLMYFGGELEDSRTLESAGMCNTVRHLVPDLAEPEDWPFLLSVVKRDGTACAYCSWRQGCLGCTISPGDEEISLAAEECIAVDWDALVLQQQYKEKFAGHVHDHESVTLATLERKTSISLQQCLSSLVKDEELSAYCRECSKKANGEFTESPQKKSLSFWACPPLLVLQLKRFHTHGGAAYKLFNEVTFGQSLDLKDFLCDGTKDCHKTKPFVDWHRPLRERSMSDEQRRWAGFPSLSREITSYRLYGVVYHIGGMGSGHYTASILHEKQWYVFNDDRVFSISEQDVPGANAYLLFFAREDVASGEMDLQHLFPDEGRKAFSADIEQIKKCSWADLHRASTKTLGGIPGERFCSVS